MTEQEEKDLKQEIQHIFDSGANEIRIFEMVKTFISRRNLESKKIETPKCEKLQTWTVDISDNRFTNDLDSDYVKFVNDNFWDLLNN